MQNMNMNNYAKMQEMTSKKGGTGYENKREAK